LKNQEEQLKRQQDELKFQQEQETLRLEEEKELRQKQEQEELRRQEKLEALRLKQEEELRKQQELEELKKQEEEALRLKEEELRQQQEQEEELRRQEEQEALRLKQEEELRKQQESQNEEENKKLLVKEKIPKLAFVQHLKSQNLKESDRMVLECEVVGIEPLEVVWLRNGKEIPNNPDFLKQKQGNKHKLVVSEIFPEDSGVFSAELYSEPLDKAILSSCSVVAKGI
jgi:hypothetical protein